MDREFVGLSLNNENIDRYWRRKEILEALQSSASLLRGRLLDVGCGKMPYKKLILETSEVNEYLGLDLENAIEYDANVQPDLIWDGLKMPLSENQFDCAIATEVLEHCPDPLLTLREIHRVLKPGGSFVFTVPFLWNLHEIPHDYFRYTPFSLEMLLTKAGFATSSVAASGGWHASMAQMLGLWAKRAPMSRKMRKILLPLVFLVYKRLLKIAEAEKVDFKRPCMITGLFGVAFK